MNSGVRVKGRSGNRSTFESWSAAPNAQLVMTAAKRAYKGRSEKSLNTCRLAGIYLSSWTGTTPGSFLVLCATLRPLCATIGIIVIIRSNRNCIDESSDGCEPKTSPDHLE